ncbi:MAG: hypothetical protein FD175_2070 [Beijerinckiaceae bacterium]|nr:MAG: hypothetical protein FD175_2070 [Beijerinckiaceae bacterium]
MRASAWLSILPEFLKGLDADDDPIERLEARVAALERSMTAASMTMPPDNPMPSDPSFESLSPSRRI